MIEPQPRRNALVLDSMKVMSGPMGARVLVDADVIEAEAPDTGGVRQRDPPKRCSHGAVARVTA